jgi:hypothetical protein
LKIVVFKWVCSLSKEANTKSKEMFLLSSPTANYTFKKFAHRWRYESENFAVYLFILEHRLFLIKIV